MIRANKFGLVFVVSFFTTINGDKGICDLFDDECISKSGNVVYPKMVAGLPGVEPSDPLHKEEITISLPRFSYKLHNATMTGLKDSELSYIKFHTNGTMLFGILVPVTEIEAYYEAYGQLGNMILNGKGVCKLTYYKHKMDFDGKFFPSKDIIDKKLHNYVKDFIFSSEVKEKATFVYENLTNQDKDLSGDELKQLDDAIHRLVMTEFLQKFVVNIDDYLRIVPLSEILARPN